MKLQRGTVTVFGSAFGWSGISNRAPGPAVRLVRCCPATESLHRRPRMPRFDQHGVSDAKFLQRNLHHGFAIGRGDAHGSVFQISRINGAPHIFRDPSLPGELLW